MAETKRAFVIGHPITQSRSPIIHNHWLSELGINGHYEAIDVAPGDVATFFQRVRSGEFRGGNVTVPHKEEALKAVDRLTPLAAEIGAVNTVWMEGGELWGDNTDISGFAANLDDHAPQWRQMRSALVLGAGGAARAVILALKTAGIAEITLLNRTVERAEHLANEFASPLTRIFAGPIEEAESVAKKAGLIINTTSLGMAGKAAIGTGDSSPITDFSGASQNAIVTDIVYVPLQTPFLNAAANAGLTTVDGLGMLLHQAVPGFERWFGKTPQVTPHLRSLVAKTIPAKSVPAKSVPSSDQSS